MADLRTPPTEIEIAEVLRRCGTDWEWGVLRRLALQRDDLSRRLREAEIDRDALMRAVNPSGFGMPHCTVEFCLSVIERMRAREPKVRPMGEPDSGKE